MGLHATAIVGYTFNADTYCPGCIEGALCDNRFSADHEPEESLDLIAAERGIDRMDESSFDSDDFPKVIFACQVESDDERCGDCGQPLIA